MTTLHDDTLLRSEDDHRIAELANTLAAAVAPTTAAHDLAGSFAHEHFALLHQHGAMGLTIPKRYGGEEISLYQTLLFQERFAKGSGSSALAFGWHLMVFGYLQHGLRWDEAIYAQLCRDAVEKGWPINVLVTERDAGNLLRGARPQTTAKKTPTGWVINGQKAFCSAAPALQNMILYTWVEEENRPAEFLVPKTEGVEIIETWDTLGMRSSGSHDIRFNNVHVGPDALLSYIEIGKSSTFTAGSRVFGLQLSAVYLGIAQAARDYVLEFAANYHVPSLNGSILQAPSVQGKIGEIEALIYASRTLLFGLAERWENNPDQRERLSQEVATTKITTTANAIRIVELAMSIMGGHSISRKHPIERYFRDVQCALFNPPQEDTTLTSLAQAAIAPWLPKPAAVQTPADFAKPVHAPPVQAASASHQTSSGKQVVNA